MNKYAVIVADSYKFFVMASTAYEAIDKINFIEPTLTHLQKDVKLVQRIREDA
tara:strand:+ start:669 stop:827 length:159 start_codon:yes stop_codon:yes gene_type:complete